MRIRELRMRYELAIRSIGFEFSLERLRLSGSQGGACVKARFAGFAHKFCPCANFEVPNRHNPNYRRYHLRYITFLALSRESTETDVAVVWLKLDGACSVSPYYHFLEQFSAIII